MFLFLTGEKRVHVAEYNAAMRAQGSNAGGIGDRAGGGPVPGPSLGFSGWMVISSLHGIPVPSARVVTSQSHKK